MTDTTPLSPAAQAVLDAWFSSERGERMLGDPACLAAALHAAADQVVPKRSMPLFVGEATHADWFARDEVRDDLLRIAAELEGAR